MAAALAHIHRVTGDATYRDAALEALAYEDTMFNAEAGTWTGEGRASRLHHQMSSWCHGAPGIALARAVVMATLGPAAAPLAPTLETALELTRATPVPSADDLCCGEAGRLEILSVLSARLGRSDLMADVDQALASRLPTGRGARPCCWRPRRPVRRAMPPCSGAGRASGTSWCAVWPLTSRAMFSCLGRVSAVSP